MTNAYSDGSVILWDTSRPGHPVQTTVTKIDNHPVEQAAISADRRLAATASMESSGIDPNMPKPAPPGGVWISRYRITLTDISDPKHPKALATVHADLAPEGRNPPRLRMVTLSPDGRTLAAPGGYITNGHLLLWDLTDPAHPQQIATPATEQGDPVSFSPDGNTLLTWMGDLRSGELWDVHHPTSGRALPLPANSILSPDWRTAVSPGSAAGMAVLWDTADLQRPHRLANLTGLPAYPTGAAFSNDGTLSLRTGDGTVTLWDVSDPGNPLHIATLPVRDADAQDLSFSPDGLALATGTGATTLWDLSALHRLRADPTLQACAMTGGGLSTEEWPRYITEIPYRKTC